MYETPTAPLTPREPAPGAQAAFYCGLWSVLLNVVAACFPLAIPLGVVALVQHGRARTAAELDPDRFEAPGATGRVLGIVGIATTLVAGLWIVVVSAFFTGFQAARQARRAAPLASASRQVEIVEAQMDLAARMLREARARRGAGQPEALVKDALEDSRLRYPEAENAYRRGEGPFLADERPERDGQISLDPRPAYQDYKAHRTYAAVVIRGRVCPPGGGIRLLERVVEVE